MTHVLVIGAGLAGLSAAIGCAKQGMQVTLCERALAFAPVGAGLTMSPSAQIGLRWLGVGDAFDAVAEPAETPVLLDWSTGAVLAAPAPAPHLAQVRRIARADLHAILLERYRSFGSAVLRLGCELAALKQDDGRISAVMADGDSLQADLLLGADGARSAVRAALFGDGEPAYTGFVAWRYVLPIEAAAPYLRGHGTSVTTGPDALLTCYTIARGTLVNCVAITRSADWAAEGWSEPGDPALLAAAFKGAHRDAQALAGLAPRDGLFRWGLFDRPVSPCWSKGRAVLLGDAAHPILPFMAYGAGLAIEDAVVLSRALAAFPLEQAFAAFERERAPRASTIHASSRAQARAFSQASSPEGAAPAPFFDTSLFTYDPTTVPLTEA